MVPMDHIPTPDETRALVHPLDQLDRKVLGGIVAIWMSAPDRIRDREFTSQQFVHVATVAHGFDQDGDSGPASSEHVERIRDYAERRMEDVLRVGLALFVRVAEDMKQHEDGFTFDNARDAVHAYLEGA